MATHGTLPPNYNEPTMTPPATGQVGPYTATQTFLIEASRGNSLIDTNDGGDFNAKWTNSANFNLRRGDRVSVEMAAFNAKNAGGGQATIELTGERARANGKIQPYSDNKVMLEVFFYLNNNNTYSVGMPFKFPTGAPQPGSDMPATPATWKNIPGVDGEMNAALTKGADWGNIFTPTTNVEESRNNYGCVGLGWGEGFARPMILPQPPTPASVIVYGNCPLNQAYGIYDFHIAGQPANTFVSFVAVGDIIDSFTLIKFNPSGLPDPTGAGAEAGIYSSYTEGYYAGVRTQDYRFNGLIGMGIKFLRSGSDDIKTIDNPPAIMFIGQQLLGAVLTDRIQVFVSEGADATDGYTLQTQMDGAAAGGFFTYAYFGADDYFFENPDSQTGLTLPSTMGPANAGMIGYDQMRTTMVDNTYYRRRGGLFGLYNENNIGQNFSGLGVMSLENRYFPGANIVAYQGEGFAGNSSIDVSGNTHNQTGFHTGHEGYRNCNLMKENNNKPYILCRNDFYGMGKVSPDLTNFMPMLKPQTAFILLDAAELFTDLETLANRINDILHQRLPMLGLENDNYSDYILDTQTYGEFYQKGSSVIPYALVNNGYYDPFLYGPESAAPAEWLYNNASMRQTWDTIPNISSGGTIKVQPANFQAGYNYAISHTNKYYYNGNIGPATAATGQINPNPLNNIYRVKQDTTFCRRVETADSQPYTESNTIYGNMCYENLPKMMMGDIFKRLPCYTPTTKTSNLPFHDPVIAPPPAIQDGLTSLSIPVILNTKLYYNEVSSTNSSHNIRTQVLDAGSIIFTNIYWLGSGSYNESTGVGTGPLDYDWKNAEIQQATTEGGSTYGELGDGVVGTGGLFDEFADSLRRYEMYSRSTNDGGFSLDKQAKDTFEGQNADNEGWSVEFDLGISDDPANCGGYITVVNGNPVEENGLYPIPPNFTGQYNAAPTDPTEYSNALAIGKTSNMLPILFPGINKFPAAANPNNLLTTVNYWGTGVGGVDSNGDITDPPNLNQTRRDRICPAFSNEVFGGFPDDTFTGFNWNQDFKTLRGIGKIKLRSRPTKDYYAKTVAGDFINVVPFQQTNPPVQAPPATAPALTPDTMCELVDPAFLATNSPGLFSHTSGTLEYYKQKGIPFVPYKHTDSDGTSRILCALIVSNRYDAKENQPNTWNIGEITWGTPLGVSPSFLDNHALCPMNGDEVNHRNRLTNAPKAPVGGSTPAEPPFPNTPVLPNRNIARNNFNYIYMGAPNPTFQFNSNKNRFEFIEFNMNTQFSAFTTESQSTSQQGQQVAIVNASTRDGVFSILDPYMWTQGQPLPAVAIPAAKIPPYTQQGPVPPVGRAIPIPNQGIRDSESGIGLWNVWLCPPDYTFPVGINPVSYWTQTDAGLTSYMGGNSLNVATPLRLAANPNGAIERNHRAIIKGCVKASRDVWEGSLLYKLGFSGEQIDPYYGRSYNRYDPNTYNNTNPNLIGTGVKPLILGCEYNNTINPAANIFYKSYPDGPPPAGGNETNFSGLPKFQNGLANNQPINVDSVSLPLTATDSPILTDSPFFLIYSNICETNYQSGSTPQPALAYVMRNFPNSGYFYGSGSNYSQMINQDRVLSQITTEVRNPSTGELAKLSPNSVLMYKIERDVVMPAPTIDALGNQPMAEGPLPLPDPNLAALNEIIAELGGGQKTGSSAGVENAVGPGGGGIQDQTGALNHHRAVNTWTIEPDGEVIQQPPQLAQVETPQGVEPVGPVGMRPRTRPRKLNRRIRITARSSETKEVESDIGGELMLPGSEAEMIGNSLVDQSTDYSLDDTWLREAEKEQEFYDDQKPWIQRAIDRDLGTGVSMTERREETAKQSLLKQGRVIDKILNLAISKVPIRVSGERTLRDANKIPDLIVRTITNLFSDSGEDIMSLISQYADDPEATVADIVEDIAPRIGGARFNLDGSIISRDRPYEDGKGTGSRETASGKRLGVAEGNSGRVFTEAIKNVIQRYMVQDEASGEGGYLVLTKNAKRDMEMIIRQGISQERLVIESKIGGKIQEQSINLEQNSMSDYRPERRKKNRRGERPIRDQGQKPNTRSRAQLSRERAVEGEKTARRERGLKYDSDRRTRETSSDDQSRRDSRRAGGTATRRGVGVPRLAEVSESDGGSGERKVQNDPGKSGASRSRN